MLKSAEKSRKMTVLSQTALLLSMSLVLSLVEAMFPLTAFLPLPGVKLGLANIATVAAFYILGKTPALCIALVRPFVMLLLSGNVFSLAMSLSGAAFAYVSLVLTRKLYGKYVSYVGVSCVSAVFHAVGQTVMCMLLLYDTAILYYLPVFAFASCITGVFCGIIMNVTLPRLNGFLGVGKKL